MSIFSGQDPNKDGKQITELLLINIVEQHVLRVEYFILILFETVRF